MERGIWRNLFFLFSAVFVLTALGFVLTGHVSFDASDGSKEDVLRTVKQSSSFQDLQGGSDSEIDLDSVKLGERDIDYLNSSDDSFAELFDGEFFQLGESYLVVASDQNGSGIYYQVSDEGEVMEKHEVSEVEDELEEERLEQDSEGFEACPSISGFPDSPLKVYDFSTSDGFLTVDLRNSGDEALDLTGIRVEREDRELTYSGTDSISPDEVKSFDLGEVQNTDFCADFNVRINYDDAGGGRQTEGKLKSSFRIG